MGLLKSVFCFCFGLVVFLPHEVWNEEVANEAQSWVNNCVYKSGCSNCKAGNFSNLGQNIFQYSTSNLKPEANWTKAISTWFEKVEKFDSNNISPFKFTKESGLYTQLVWAETYAVGCGYINYKDGDWYRGFYNCYYGPAGNLQPGVMYNVGKECTACPPEKNTCLDSLCS